jgi:hypothetical protein
LDGEGDLLDDLPHVDRLDGGDAGMTVAAWIGSLQKFDPALDVIVRVDSDEHDLVFTAQKPVFIVDSGCTETEMLMIDMADGDEGITEE